MIELIGWIGAVTMVGASFKMSEPLGLKMAIVGLALLSIQAYDTATYNLLALNICSIIVFSISLIRKEK